MDEGFVVNQEGIGLRLTAMEYWKCSKAGVLLPSVDKGEPDCKFVIAESLPKQGDVNRLSSVPMMQLVYNICILVNVDIFQVEIRWTPSWSSTGPQESSTSGCTQKT